MARGLGVYAAGAGYYNQQTAVARSINTDTVMRWNEYVYESQMESNRIYWANMASQPGPDQPGRRPDQGSTPEQSLAQ